MALIQVLVPHLAPNARQITYQAQVPVVVAVVVIIQLQVVTNAAAPLAPVVMLAIAPAMQQGNVLQVAIHLQVRQLVLPVQETTIVQTQE